ncbi:hypothetical protein PVAND_008546 [Polypedilum vanderplanki]|uniref:Uncharacterized protein n=1 Tax=Polypedilum vanderplanki TaxID=319348 RepID=A0A9J6CAZ7_POLVA|nr:hypothetical protein PVAND_008546 [Polypedilum vanderplanki]
MEEENSDVIDFKNALYEKFKEFLHNNDVSIYFRNMKDKEFYDSLNISHGVLSSSAMFDTLNMNILKDIEVNLTRMQQIYEKFKKINGLTISLSSSSNSDEDEEEQYAPQYVMAKRIKWKMPNKIRFISRNIPQKNINQNPNMRVNPLADRAKSTVQSNTDAQSIPVISNSTTAQMNLVTPNNNPPLAAPILLVMVPMSVSTESVNQKTGQPIYYNQQPQSMPLPVIQQNIQSSAAHNFHQPQPDVPLPLSAPQSAVIQNNQRPPNSSSRNYTMRTNKFRPTLPRNNVPHSVNMNNRSDKPNSFAEHKERKRIEEEKRRKIAFEKASKVAEEERRKKVEEANKALRQDEQKRKERLTRWSDNNSSVPLTVQLKPQLENKKDSALLQIETEENNKSVSTISVHENNFKKVKPIIHSIEILNKRNEEKEINYNKASSRSNSNLLNTPPPSPPEEKEKERTQEKMIEIPASVIIPYDDDDDNATVRMEYYDEVSTERINNSEVLTEKVNNDKVAIERINNDEVTPVRIDNNEVVAETVDNGKIANVKMNVIINHTIASQFDNKSKSSIDSIPATVQIDNSSKKSNDSLTNTVQIDNESVINERIVKKEKQNDELPIKIKQEKLDYINIEEREAQTDSEEETSNESFYKQFEKVVKNEDFLRLVRSVQPQHQMTSQEKVQTWIDAIASPNHDQVYDYDDDDEGIWEKSGEDFGDSQTIIPFEPSSQIADIIKQELESSD